MSAAGIFIAIAASAVLPSAQAADTCLRATRALAVGAVPGVSDFTAVACDGTKSAPAVRYDAAMRAARMTRALQPGDVIAAIPASMMAGISPGQKLFVQVHVGPVVVQREVEALQPASPGQKLFVRAADGTVMSVRFTGDAG
ncbi:hypothetical protein [Asticcacaulis solisilvae]|uniref:hypothetical protein n=1 Tax=Asticcacaulis solisilvae TaxID=1217274 RepID=UPI003FD84EC8